ncbi:hypothetical protein [Niveispirillum irakense]|uniref:hypothetical protein n=1 Tax=Niveispirillum irakense TaxID=34011 RepID=UPI00040FDBB9|nr:hypothetical protein [Niveispirillum irakense]
MRFHVLVFAAGDDEAFERVMPLRFQGRYLAARNWPNRITVSFMSGFERLSPGYIAELRDLGYEVTDRGAWMDEIRAGFPTLTVLPAYFSFTYLRWLLLERLIRSGEAELPAVLIDGDLLLTSHPDDILADVRGKTFMIQGCPCFTTISDMGWFEAYREEVTRFARDPVAFAADAVHVRDNPTCPDREFCNVSLFTTPFRHEQDLQEYLIAAGRLPQDRTARVFDSDFYWVQNPLFPGEWVTEQKGEPLFLWRDGQIWNRGRRVPFVHFQNDFSDYAWRYMTVDQWLGTGLGSLVPPQRRGPLLSGRIIAGLIRRTPGYRPGYSRLATYERSMTPTQPDGTPPIIEIMNSRWKCA